MKLIASFLLLLFAGTASAQAPEGAAGPASAPPAVPQSVPDENILNLDLSTGGRVIVLLRPDIAPDHVERIRTLAGRGFYDGLTFHRVIPGFMAQGGDPLGTGAGGSDLPDLEAEFTRTPHLRGTVSMARAEDEDSANSQFFINFMPVPQLDENYTVFGRVFSGMEYVDAIAPGEPPANPDRIVQARIGRDVPPPSPALAAAAAPPAAAIDPALLALPPGVESNESSAAAPPAAEGTRDSPPSDGDAAAAESAPFDVDTEALTAPQGR